MANQHCPLFPELKSMVSKVIGLDQVVEGIVNPVERLLMAFRMGYVSRDQLRAIAMTTKRSNSADYLCFFLEDQEM